SRPHGVLAARARLGSRHGVQARRRCHRCQGAGRAARDGGGAVAICETVRVLPGHGRPAAAVAAWGNLARPPNVLFGFQETAQGAEWTDDIARTALAVMRPATSRIVVGHLDWSAKNMRMGPQGIAVVYDWDAVFLDRETFVVGAAAAHFPMTWELDVP